MKKLYMGIDLGVEVCAWCVLDRKGRTVNKGEFKTCEKLLIDAVTDHPGKVIVMFEECEIASWAKMALVPYVHEVIVCDPRRNAWISKSTGKSDRIDAYKLAELLRIDSYVSVYSPETEEMILFKMFSAQELKASRELATEKGKLKALLRRLGISYAEVNPYTDKGFKKLVEKEENPDKVRLLTHTFRTVKFLETQKKAAVAILRTYVPRMAILVTFLKVPGVGIQTVTRWVAHIQTPHRFKKKQDIWKYCGLGIVKRSSDGKSLCRERLDRQANGTLKDVSRKVFNAAMACHSDNLFKRTYRQSLKRTGNKDHARLNTQRKIIAVLWAMWKNGTEYDDTIKPA